MELMMNFNPWKVIPSMFTTSDFASLNLQFQKKERENEHVQTNLNFLSGKFGKN